jgi:uncharacterized protein (TIGR02599 family)
MKAHFPAAKSRGFTLLELLVSMAILAILMLVCTSAVDQTQKTWVYARSKVEQFREARTAFELITRNLSQATLNTYLDYYYQETNSNQPPTSGTATPVGYVRQSELQFRTDFAWQLLGSNASASANPGHAVFFQAPLGLSLQDPGLGSLLNARGYFIKYASDESDRPPFVANSGVAPRFRYRLFEYRPPSEQNASAGASFKGDTIYTDPTTWFQDDLTATSVAVADNVLLLLFSPRVSDDAAQATGKSPWWIAPNYRFNSLDRDNSTAAVDPVSVLSDGTLNQGTRNLLPPLMAVTMVAIDEASAQHWNDTRKNQAVDILGEAGAFFTDPASYSSDLGKLKSYLTDQKLNFRVFTATVILKNAQWDGTSY